MIEKVKISNIQTALLTVMIICGGQILFIPFFLSEYARQDSWIGAVIGSCFGLSFIFLYTSCARRFPNMSFPEINEKIVGKFFGPVISFLFYIYFFILISIMSRDLGDFFKIQMLPETPIVAIQILSMAVVVFAVRLGLETFARAVEVIFPYLILLFIVLTVFSLPNIKIENFQPMFEVSALPFVNSVIVFQFFTYLQLIVFFLIFPSLEGSGKHNKPFIIGGIIGGLMLIILTFLAIGVLGTDSLLSQYYPSYILAKKIRIGDFVTRIEVFIAGIWFITIFFKTTLYFYALSLGIAQSLKLNDYKVLTIPLGILAILYSLIVYPNTVYLSAMLPYWNSMIFTFGLLIPLFLLIISKIRKL